MSISEIAAMMAALMVIGSMQADCAPVEIRIDCASKGQTWEGWGGTDLCSFDGMENEQEAGPPGTIPPRGRQQVLKMLYQDLGWTRVRFAPTGYEPTNDNDDPFAINPDGFDWKGKRVRPWTALDPYCEDNLVMGRKFRSEAEPFVFYPATNCPEQWMSRTPQSENWYWDKGGRFNPDMVEEYAEHALAGALHVKQVYGYEFPYWSLFNEPSNTARPSKETTLALVLATGRRFKANGLKTKLVICDDVTPEDSAEAIEYVLADAEARGYVGAVSYHRYRGDFVLERVKPMLSKVAKGKLLVSEPVSFYKSAVRYGKSVWLSEQCSYGDNGITHYDAGRARANHICDEINNGLVNAFDFMLLYFIERGRPGNEECPIFLRFAGGKYSGAEINPIGYWIRQFSRYIRPGSVRLDVSVNDPLIKAVAFNNPRNGAMIVVVVNNHPEEVAISIRLGSPTRKPARAERVRTSPDAMGRELPEVAITDSVLTDTLPGTSVTTYVLR